MGTIHDQQTAQAIYNVAYLPYALFLSLGTAGFPSGIAKKIAELNIKGNKNQIKKLFKSGLIVIEIIGILSALLMFIFAPTLSKISPIVDHTAGITAIRSLCFSLSTFYRKKRNLFQLKDFYFLPLKSISHMKGLATDIIRESLPFVYVGSVISIL